MIECPQCNNNITGFVCSCGYKVPSKFDGPQYKHRDKFKDDADHLREGQIWLMNQGITNKEMTADQWQAATRAYRKQISRAPREPSNQWAKNLLQKFEDGEMISKLQERMAKSALGIEI